MPLTTPNNVSGSSYSLEALVQETNQRLPEYLPEDYRGRVRSEVNARLIRHYASLGLLDEARREGKEARYEERHLLQILVLRKFLTQGYSSEAIRNLTRGTNGELVALLEGDVIPGLAPTNAATKYLDHVRERREVNKPCYKLPDFIVHPNPAETKPVAWQRFILSESIEVHVKTNPSVPKTPSELRRLKLAFEAVLKTVQAKP